MVKTKIICTLGPASHDKTTLRKMMRAGMDVVRLNFSHGSHAEHKERIHMIRQLNRKTRRRVKVLQDLEGFRIRLGTFKDHKDIAVKKRQIVWLVKGDIKGHDNIIPFDYEGPLKDIKKNQHIYIDDGNIALLVKSREKKRLKTEVIIGGTLKEHKGVNIPGAKLKFSGVTDKDICDMHFGIQNKVDFMAQSFVRTKDDILTIKKVVSKVLPKCGIIAKIENEDGIRNIDEIIDVSDGIMVARGDMGVSLPIYEIPIMQKMIIKKCNAKRKFVITATQMLESMTEHLRPTRAEVTDVANAILDGTNYVMLSGETAVGLYPSQTVRMMNDIIKYTEKSKLYKK